MTARSDWRTQAWPAPSVANYDNPDAQAAVCPDCGGTVYRGAFQRNIGTFKQPYYTTIVTGGWRHLTTRTAECPTGPVTA